MKLSFTKFCLPMALCALTISLLSCAQARITIANNGKSTFTIVIPEEAPTSVEVAALELQKDIELATEAKLALQRDNHHVGTSIISLGNTQYAKKAGISSDDMADGAYRIITKNGNLYIIGIDTPDGGWTENNGVSSGTASGVYTFLEDYLGVRWLMPGELGRDVPAKSTFSIDAINRTEKPLFNYRRLPYTYYYADPSQHGTILDWHTHMRIGRRMSPVSISATHNWWKTINASNGGSRSTSVNTDAVKQLYKEHPEWFAMDDNGNRPYPVNKYAKLETTNQELVKWFAEQAIKNLKDSERPRFYSLSPSDGNLWSQSPESKALYDPSPPSKSDEETDAGEPGMSSLVLKWYHDVAQRVAKEYPQGKLTGYIYASFLYPPTKIKMKLPDNFTPIIATSIDYGYKLYRPQTQELYKTILGEWAKVAPENWYYYGIPNLKGRQDAHEVGNDNFPGTTGIITPAAPDILNLVFSTLLKNHIKGAYIYGANSWSNAAMANYIVAKMEWNPTLDAYDVQREWLQRAYGDRAGEVMGQFYRQLNGWYREYYQRHPDAALGLQKGMLKNLYAAHYSEMEDCLLKANAQQMTPKQQQRLQLIINNMVVLQWRLRNGGLLPSDYESPLHLSNAAVIALLTKYNKNFPLYPNVVPTERVNWHQPKAFPFKVEFSKVALSAEKKSTFKGMGESQFLLYAAQEGTIRILPQMVTQGVYFAGYKIQNQAGEVLQSGILSDGIPITLPAKKGHAYYLDIALRNTVNYKLEVENAAVAEGNFANKTLTLSGSSAPVYVYCPPSKAPVGITQKGNSVIIRKPFSGMTATAYMRRLGNGYKDIIVLESFDLNWRFSPDPQAYGLKRGVTSPDFDDSSWPTISALNWWQFQGFPDYHGVAWYRKTFTLDKTIPKGRIVYLYFGAIDGNAVIYLNGEKIREHQLGDNYEGWNRQFGTYNGKKIKPGENTIVVKVTSKNDESASGIFKGVSLLTATRIMK